MLVLKRFWYENEAVFTKEQIQEIKRTTLARVLCDTSDSLTHIKQDVFTMNSTIVNCNQIPKLRLELWTADDCCDAPGNAAESFCRLKSRLSRHRKSNEVPKRRFLRSTFINDDPVHMQPLFNFYTEKFDSFENAINYLRNVTGKL